MTPTDAETAPPPARASTGVRLLRTPSLLGVALALVAMQQSLVPTLMVRDWYFQGVVSGLAVAVGYGVGTLLTRVARAIVDRAGWRTPHLSPRTDLRIRAVLAVSVLLVVAAMSRRAVAEHRWTWRRLGHDPGSVWLTYGGTLLVTTVVAALLLAIASAVGWLRRRAARAGRRLLPRWLAGTLATVLVVWLLVTLLNTWVYQRTLDGLNEAFTAADRQLVADQSPPTSELRSGGPASEVAWEEMGSEGRRFVRRGPDADQVAGWSPDGTATEPVRVFVGRATTPDPEELARLAVDELERFGAFDREAVLVVVPTGTGWVNEQVVQPVEYFLSGDVATVAVQYSHLPSPLAFLTEAEAAQRTGTALVDAVHARIEEQPADRRPQLLVAGESLGSFGGSSAYDSLDEMLDRSDAALWVGPPAMMHLRTSAEEQRRPGSLQIRPVVGDGTRMLFANRASDITGHPEAVFLQHADDAIVWWDWSTMWAEPDWMREPLDPAVNPALKWYPVTTFLNLAVDMAVSTAFEEDQGHKYGTQPALAWAAMLDPEGWDPDRVDALRERLTSVAR